jgi:two-component system, response regulator FlrC
VSVNIKQHKLAAYGGAARNEETAFDPPVTLSALRGNVTTETTKTATVSGLPHDDGDLIANAQVSRQLVELARRVAASECTVLIAGESGTGKEVLARFIHRNSTRATGPFVAVNCAAIPENMLEALLFGYERGAFTGAVNLHAGKFEQAHGGTLLLDEVTEMPLGL